MIARGVVEKPSLHPAGAFTLRLISSLGWSFSGRVVEQRLPPPFFPNSRVWLNRLSVRV